MKSKIFKIVFILIGALLLAACNAGAASRSNQATPTPIPPVASGADIVAEGKIMPRDSRDLAFFSSGQVEEVLVKEGDHVKAGDVIASLGDSERIQAQIAGAEVELTAAQRALSDLQKNENLEVARVAALRAMAAANKALKDAQYNLDNISVPTNQKKLTPIEGVKAMKDLLDKARANFEPYKYEDSGNSTRETLKDRLDNAQADYNSAVRRLSLETDRLEAQAKLDKAMSDYQALASGPQADDLAAAQARVNAAQASLTSAKASLKDLNLVATIDGDVVKQNLIVGQQITPGQAVMTIADFSKLYAETDNLTEIEVVDVSPGQKVTVTADALPGVEMTGVVDSINKMYEESRGDILYTAKILLDKPDPRLRWGMSVVTTFQK